MLEKREFEVEENSRPSQNGNWSLETADCQQTNTQPLDDGAHAFGLPFCSKLAAEPYTEVFR